MKKSLSAIIAAMSITFYSPVLAAESSFTLNQCIEAGLLKNPSYRASELMVDWAELEKKSALGQFLPSLSADGSFARLANDSSTGPTDTDYIDQDNTSYSIRLSQVLYAGSRLINAYTKADAQKEMYAANSQLAKLDLIYKIETAFFQMKKAEQDVEAIKDTVERLKSSQKAAEAFFKQSMAPYAQVLQTRVDLADAEQNLSMAENTIEKKRLELLSLMNVELDPKTRFTGDLEYYKDSFGSDYDKCWEKAAANRSDIKSLEQQIIMADKTAAIAAGKYLPTLRVDYGYYDQTRDYEKPGISLGQKYDRDQENSYWKTGATATWQLFDGGSAWFERKKSMVEIEKLKEQIKDTENKIKVGIRAALFSISESEQRIKVTKIAVEAAKEYYANEDKRFRAGISTIPALLEAQARLTKAETNKNQAMLDYQIARSGMNFMTGETARSSK